MAALGFLIFGYAALVGAYLLEGGAAGALVVDTAAIIVFGGTIASVGLSFPMSELKRFMPALKKVFSSDHSDHIQKVFFYVDTASLVRREGVLALEKSMQASDGKMSSFTRIGLQMVVDGVERNTIRDILEYYVQAMSERHKLMVGVFEAAGGYSPTMGIIGTVMGLVHVLGNLSEPDKLGPSIAVAFIATLYGVSTANLVWLPMANRLKIMNHHEVHEMNMEIEAIMMVEQGFSHNLVEEKMKAFLAPAEKTHLESVGKH